MGTAYTDGVARDSRIYPGSCVEYASKFINRGSSSAHRLLSSSCSTAVGACEMEEMGIPWFALSAK